MNIFGEGFPPEIINQVAVRQKAYGSGYSSASSRTHEQILYLNGNSSWCKLVSGVDIDNIALVNSPSIQALYQSNPDIVRENRLAKSFMLFNGTSTYNGGLSIPREGISLLNSLSGVNGAYGIGGTEFGLRPMMGIMSATINHENRGSLRRAQIKIKAWNRVQFEIVDILYLRLGFSVLLEWGNSMYYDNNGDLQTNVNNSLDYAFFAGLKGSVPYDNMLLRIANQRLATGGNYDAMFGKVTNFHWSFMPDGSYDITVDISSVGDIIESLKLNTLTGNSFSVGATNNSNNTVDPQTLPIEELVLLYALKHDIGGFLYSLVQKGDQFTNINNNFSYFDLKEGVSLQIPSNKVYTETALQLLNYNPEYETQYKNATDGKLLIMYYPNPNSRWVVIGDEYNRVYFIKNDAEGNKSITGALKTVPDPFINLYTNTSTGDNTVLNSNQFANSTKDIIKIVWDGDLDEEYYLRLGTLLEYIQNFIIIKTKNTPWLKFDYQLGNNIVFLDPLQVSIDPTICVTSRTLSLSNSDGTTSSYSFIPEADSFVQSELSTNIGTTTYGDLMNVYLSFRYILLKIEENKDDKGKVKLIDFLQSLLQGINGALGGINDLDVFIDESTNIVKVIDKNPLPNLDKVLTYYNLSTTPAFFDLYGYSKKEPDENNPVYNGGWHSSFIREFSFTTELTPEFSTMITVGAAANGVVVGENDTALSKLNKGLKDRFKPEVSNTEISEIINQQIELKEELTQEVTKLSNNYNIIYNKYVDFLEKLSEYEVDREEIDAYKDTLTNLIQIKLQIQKIKDQLATLENPYIIQKNSPGTGFIPFNLSLTMDGLSGMKINQQFTIDTSYLPSNYPDTVKFLIKNMTHTIQNNKWTTKLDSYCIASGIYEEENLVTVESNEFIGPVNPPNATPNPDWSKYKPANTFGGTLRLNQAVKDQSTYVYSKGIYAPSKGLKTPMGYGEVAGYCAGYTYNIAYKLKEYIDTNSSSPITFTYQKAGNANANQHRANIQALGIYDMYYLGDYTAKELSNNFFNKYSWNIGDIVNYYAPNDSPESNMHSQIYTGNIWTSSTWTDSKGEKQSAGNSKWSTSTATNYGSSFVYDSSNIVFKVYAFKVIPSYLV